jgi:hypothetical protein
MRVEANQTLQRRTVVVFSFSWQKDASRPREPTVALLTLLSVEFPKSHRFNLTRTRHDRGIPPGAISPILHPAAHDSSRMSAPHTTLREDLEINVNDAADVLRWSEELGVTELELREAVRNVGPRLDDVKHTLSDMLMEQCREEGYDEMLMEEGAEIREREGAPLPRREDS